MRIAVVLLTVIGSVMGLAPVLFGQSTQSLPPKLTEASAACIECHAEAMPGLVMEWRQSRHFAAKVGCFECHAAAASDPDAMEHNGYTISVIVSPKDCAKCHPVPAAEFAASHHADAGALLGSLDNMLGEVVEGPLAAVSGCKQCHGAVVKLNADKTLDPLTWPNTGIGRLNPDGSKGSCHACHSRHSFEAKLSRSPENCGKCHLGPDHPQMEIYNESKHGIAFYANRDKMALDKANWVLGKNYSAAPTCASCHISSYMTTNGVAVANNHDVGERISWTLRPVISTKLNLVIYTDGYREDYPETKPLPKIGAEVTTTESVVENEKMIGKPVKRTVAKIVTWQERRNAMKGACLNCHGSEYVDNFYQQFDSLVALYNDKFARPAQKIMDELTADGVLNPKAPFEHEVQWVFWELWHHEGRRARHGASMMGPDYTHWHGMYEVSKHFYEKFLPAVVEAAKQKSPELGKKYEAEVQQLLTRDEHRWLKGLSPEEVEALKQSYKERYNQ